MNLIVQPTLRVCRRAPYAAVLLMLAFLATACGRGSDAVTAGPPPAVVDVLTVGAAPAVLTQDLPGRLQAVRSAQIRARVEGVIERQLYADGSEVKAGTPLFQIDARSYRAAQLAAEADVASQRALLKRYAALLESKAISAQEYDATQAKTKAAEAALARAALDLENALPIAPISGRAGRALVTVGALVGKGEATHLTTVEQLDPIRVEFTQPYSDAMKLRDKPGATSANQVELILDDERIYPQKGRLTFRDLAVDPATGSVVMRAEFPNPERKLLPGAFVRIRLPLMQQEAVIRVPQRAVSTGVEGQSVFLVDPDDKLAVRPVTTGGMIGGDYLIIDGLKPGDRIVVNGAQKARPGSVVKPVPWPAPADQDKK